MPSGERLPGVLWPWAGSRRMSMVLSGDSSGIPGAKVGKNPIKEVTQRFAQRFGRIFES